MKHVRISNSHQRRGLSDAKVLVDKLLAVAFVLSVLDHRQ